MDADSGDCDDSECLCGGQKAAREAGMDGYITKPVDVDGMIRTLLKFV